MITDSQSVVLTSLELGQGFWLSRARLNSESTLNSLTRTMITELNAAFDQCESDPNCVAIFLEGTGEKAFCAGGDIRAMYNSMVKHGASHNPEAIDFFESEYQLDYRIHKATKPIIVWGTGFVMGGGLGLFAGAQHRIVTETSKIAMPEISIGLYPDVGGSYFLNKLPKGVGLFLGLSAHRLMASDSQFLGLSNHYYQSSDREKIPSILKDRAYKAGDLKHNAALVFETLSTHEAAPTDAPLRAKLESIQDTFRYDSLEANIGRWTKLAARDDFFKKGLETFHKGSPTSAKIIFEQLRRTERMSLEECFALETVLTIQFAAHHDFREGIRALVIDKDNVPKWNPKSLGEVSADIIAAHYKSPEGYKNPFHKRTTHT
jgi:enoyl-CoA hydratase/carnithine racemase